MMTLRVGIVAAVLASGSGLAQGQVDAASKQQIEQMAEAVKTAKAISYKVEFSGLGAFALLPTIRLDVTLQKDAEHNTWKSRVEGRRDEVTGTPQMPGVPAVEILAASDGTLRTWVDVPTKTVTQRPETQGSTNDVIMSAGLGAVREITLLPEPFPKELAAPTIKPDATPTIKVDGVDCDVVVVDEGPNMPTTKWAIGREDHLPRAVERNMGIGKQVWQLSHVKLNPTVSEDAFTIKTPEGFTFNGMPKPAAPAAAVPTTIATPTTVTLPDTAPAKPRVLGTSVNDLAPDFELAMPTGEKVKLSALKGSVVVLDFWGTWCLPCRQASPEVQKLADTYKDKGVKVFGLAVRETSDEKPVAYWHENKHTYGLLLKADDVAKTYKVRMYPTYAVIGKEGEIYYLAGGYEPGKTMAAVTDAVERALAGAPVVKPAAPVTTTDEKTVKSDK